MKIVQLTAENIKKISVVDITPNGNLVQITGKNGQGKSSVLDAIWMALAGAKHHPDKPIREGAETACITIDMGQYVVTRTFTVKGTTLNVKSKEGASFSKPQDMLDKMLGDLAFDPLEFSRMKPKEQYDRMRAVTGLGDQLDVIEGQIKTVFDERTTQNAKVSMLESNLYAAPPVPEGTPDDPVDVSAVIAEGEMLRDENNETAKWAESVTKGEAAIIDLETQLETARKSIADGEVKLAEARKLLAEAKQHAAKPLHDLAPLRQKVADASTINANVENKKRVAGLTLELMLETAKAQAQTERIEALRADRLKLIEGAKMPVPGLTLQDGQIYLNGIPFTQASTAEQLKVSLGIAMAANPSIRVIRIKDGSLLDDENMRIVKEMAEDHDYQVWCERVDGSGEVGIVMEDGHVKADHQAAAGE